MKYALINGIILVGTKDMEPIKDKIILINGKMIEDITDLNYSTDGYKVIDLNGKYIMPGLINMHVHLPASGKVKKKASDPVKLVKLITANSLTRRIGIEICKKAALEELYSGVTTIRCVGGVSDFDSIIRDNINRGKWSGPRIFCSDMALSVEGGHMAHSLAYALKDKNDAVNKVDLINRKNVDLIKLMITGGVLDAKKEGEPGEVKMSAELVKTSCERAHELGLKVAAHVESYEGVKLALENGVDSIEHGACID